MHENGGGSGTDKRDEVSAANIPRSDKANSAQSVHVEVRRRPRPAAIYTLSCNIGLANRCWEALNTTRTDAIIVFGFNGEALRHIEHLHDRSAEGRFNGDWCYLDVSPFNYSRHHNTLLRRTEEMLGYRPEFSIFLNDDVIVRPGWLTDMLAVFDEYDDACAVGIKLVYPPSGIGWRAGRIQCCGDDPGPYHTGAHRGVNADPFAEPFVNPPVVRSWVLTGACMAVRTEDFWTYGPFDEGYVDAHQDTDLCVALKQGTGGHCYVVQHNFCYHDESATRDTNLPDERSMLAAAQHGGLDFSALQRRVQDNKRFMDKWGDVGDE